MSESKSRIVGGVRQPRPGTGRCPVCSSKVVIHGEAEVLVKNAILRVDSASGRVTAKCPRCKAWVEVPLRYIG
jgi:DNA-directed RNA polymerase subunit RPC12/RpoP